MREGGDAAGVGAARSPAHQNCHPADFTPVCTTELGRVGRLSDEWAKRNTKVIALSVDSVEDHAKWKPDIEEVTHSTVGYPIIADPDKQIAELYDMIHPGEGDSSSVRSVFIISPDNLRVLDALQLTESGLTRPRSTGAPAIGRSSPTT